MSSRILDGGSIRVLLALLPGALTAQRKPPPQVNKVDWRGAGLKVLTSR